MGTQRSILIVDDEFGLAEMLREMLREHGYDVCLAINGRLALDILGERQIDLVITDIMMPVMDGIELATAIRHSEIYRDLPVVIMTSLPSPLVNRMSCSTRSFESRSRRSCCCPPLRRAMKRTDDGHAIDKPKSVGRRRPTARRQRTNESCGSAKARSRESPGSGGATACCAGVP